MHPNQPGTKTRIAPTPSGFLHLGNAFSFALTAAVADRYNMKIVLRIDDLDRPRVQPQYVQDVFDTLDFLDIPWHEGPRHMGEFESAYSQRHRMDLYRNALDGLTDSGAVFACECSRTLVQRTDANGVYRGHCRGKALTLDAPEVKWRLHTQADDPLTIRTLERSITRALPAEQQHFVVRKKDGMPAYQLASVIDDHYFGIDFVVRGTDLWPSTLAQHYLAGVLGLQRFRDSTFHHHTLLTAPDGRKLSKSAGDVSIRYLRKAGKTRAEVYHLIAGLAGIRRDVRDWRELGDVVLRNGINGE